MFKLQRLEITGFKSFADYTEIVFTGNGITAVVGPNGCGKSNVSDAISWVLGEQRAKSLRGGDMKDVIFQGTKNRKASGVSEVVLHLVRDGEATNFDDAELEDIDETLAEFDENAVDIDTIEGLEEPEQLAETTAGGEANGFHPGEVEVEKVQAAQVGSLRTVERTVKTKRHWRPRSFALDFAPGEAVAVTRRLYLSGESEYQLNGKTCRLRDIQDLFAGTGLSGSHYAIVEQGRIGQILSAKPGDRRNLIEEAAGISKFRTRQRAAESRLESAKTNLGRIGDIVSEVEKQANSLRRQAGKTRRYVALQEDFRILLRKLFAAEGRHYSALIERLKVELEQAIGVEKELLAKVAETEALVRETTQKARTAEEKLGEVRSLHSQNALERDRAEREHRYKSEQIVSLSERVAALKAEIATVEERAELAVAEIERLRADDERESADARAAQQVLMEAEGLFAAKIDDVRKIEAELEEKRTELLKHSAAMERLGETERHLKINLERLGERAEGLRREGDRAAESRREHLEEAERHAATLITEREKLQALHAEREGLTVKTEAARQTLRVSEEGLHSTRLEHSRNNQRLETLQELDENRAVYAPEVQTLFAASKEIGVKPVGVLADFLKVSAEAERAVESLFGRFLQTVIVASPEDAAKVSRWLETAEVGGIASMIAPNAGGGEGTPPVNGSSVIGDLIGVDTGLRAVLEKLFPREMSAQLVESLDDPRAAEAAILVNGSGDLLIDRTLFVSGRQPAGEKNASLLAFKRELAGLGKTVSKLVVEIEKAEAVVAENRARLAEAEERTVDLQSVIIKVERGLDALELQERTARQDIERAERHIGVIKDEQMQLERENEELTTRRAEARIAAQNAEDSASSARSELERVSELLMRARQVSDSENAVLNEKRTVAATSDERRRSVQSALRRVENGRKELESRLAMLSTDLVEAELKISELTGSVSALETALRSGGSAVEEETLELAKHIEELSTARSLADNTSEQLAELNHSAGEARNGRAELDVRQAEAVTQFRNISEHCVHELNVTIEQLAESEIVPEDFDLENSRSTADELRERLDSFGAINMLAVEELTEAEERLLFLTTQRDDIVSSISAAEEALREIKERSRERFKKAFEAINENFKEFFMELFGGGRGEMTLLEADDVLEAGIEVVAQPPGKRLQNILLLSGGEKAMTAIALVLAIFRYRPSPFCLLDEVDAPLDDANVGRFVGKIATMAEKTQFIVITHNKRTMEAARALYGVTMQEPGVSSIVSVKFD
ncbi:MAG: chromosome segregation protein SMC [Blastocatellia bacterium]|nr:chromosome segregation protein SMC [Blastocatellia bacterium]